MSPSEIAELEAVSRFTFLFLDDAPDIALFRNIAHGLLKLVCESTHTKWLQFFKVFPQLTSSRFFFLVCLHISSLGNTCYMNATVQALRAIPELQAALNACAPPPTEIASALRDLFSSMDNTKKTKGTVTPTGLLQQLRIIMPKFGVMDSSGAQYAQHG
jgi:hypothetical protein